MRRTWLLLAVIPCAVLLLVVGGIGLGAPKGADTTAATAAAPGPAPIPAGAPLGQVIQSLQVRLRAVPRDYASWGALGLAYVQQARVTADPTYYGKAEGSLRRSLQINTSDNFVADAGMAALTAARHDFAAARSWALRGLTVDPSNATLYGALDDADTQLGDYPGAFSATQRMLDLVPDSSSLARASYTWELRGNLGLATQDM